MGCWAGRAACGMLRLVMVMRSPEPAWIIDPDDPRAPPDEIWDAMSPQERKRIVAALPSEFPLEAFPPPEGDPHFNAKVGARDVLGGYYARIGRRVYIACELPVYYPGQKVFAPDVIAVLDVDTHERQSWVVRDEGKGLDFALEILVRGDRAKDLKGNVERYAQLGIAEYFVFDRGRLHLAGHRLPAPGARAYHPVLPQGGFYASHVLGLDLRIEGNRLRFYHAAMALPDSNELIRSLERMVDDVEARLRAAEERAAEEARLREEAERKLAEAQSEIERLKAERGSG
jgi:Uma2 family endonuclease